MTETCTRCQGAVIDAEPLTWVAHGLCVTCRATDGEADALAVVAHTKEMAEPPPTPEEKAAEDIMEEIEDLLDERGIELLPHVAERLFDDILQALEERASGSGESSMDDPAFQITAPEDHTP